MPYLSMLAWQIHFPVDLIQNVSVFQFMVQSQLSKLKLTKIITVLPFFLVINNCSKPLRYMEENNATDLWFDLAVGQVCFFYNKVTLSSQIATDVVRTVSVVVLTSL